jgi:hypothetical protein
MKHKLLFLTLIALSSYSFAHNSTRTQNHVKYFDQHWQNAGEKHQYRNQHYRCWNAWGEPMRRSFNRKESRLIELAGGECSAKQWAVHFNEHRADLSAIKARHFPVNKVYRAARQISKAFELEDSVLLKAIKVKQGKHWFKYTLVFDTPYGKRKFRVKHRPWNAEVLEFREV